MPHKKKKKPKNDPPPDTQDLPEHWELQVEVDGVPRRFSEYMRDFTRRWYPDVGEKLIMVPPLVFHQNWLISNKGATRQLRAASTANVFSDVTVTDPSSTAESTRRSSVAEYRVAEWFKHLAHHLGGPAAIILGHKFENYLNRVKKKMRNVKLPADVLKEGARGEHDLLFIRPSQGVLLVSVKSTGGTFSELGYSDDTQAAILQKVLRAALTQLQKEVEVAGHVLSDLSPPVTVTSVIALPNIPRKLLRSVLAGDATLQKELDGLLTGNTSELCLCLEDFPALAQSSPSQPDEAATSSRLSRFGIRFPGTASSNPPVLSQEQYEDVVGRYCGLCSTVEVVNRSKGRIEVRCLPEAVTEVNRRFKSLILLPEQASLLSSFHPRAYLHGPMGSGKTVMLRLKARHWLTTGTDVIVVNVGYDSDGSPIGHALLSDIREGLEGGEHQAHAGIVNLRLAEFDSDSFLHNINSMIKEMRRHRAKETSAEVTPQASSHVTSEVLTFMTSERENEDPVHFVLDEVYPGFQLVFDVLLKNFSSSQVWAAGLEENNSPKGFHTSELKKVLRNPPSVQRLLREFDHEPTRRDRYTTLGAEEGLPAEGPTPRFLFHQNHTSSSSSSSSPSPSSSSFPPSSSSSPPSSSSFCSSSSSSPKSPFSFLSPYWPMQCGQCATETMRILQEIGLGPPQKAEGETVDKPGSGSTSAKRPGSTSAQLPKKTACTSDAAGKTTGSGFGVASFRKSETTPIVRLSFKDVVFLCKDPEARRVYPKVGDAYRLDSQLLQAFTDAIERSAFVRTLRAQGCPVTVVSSVSSAQLALPVNEEEATASWVNPASGLEWAVVIFVPGDPPLAQVSPPAAAGEALFPAATEEGLVPAATEVALFSAATKEALFPAATEEALFPAATEEALFPAATEEALFPAATEEALFPAATEEALFPAATEEALFPEALFSETSEVAVRTSTTEEVQKAQLLPHGKEGQKNTLPPESKGQKVKPPHREQYQSLNQSDFEEGLRAVRMRMSERDRKYLFWAASRCTAQLIVLIP